MNGAATMSKEPIIPNVDTMPMKINRHGPVSPHQRLVCPTCGHRMPAGRYSALRKFVHSRAYRHDPGASVDVRDYEGDWHRVTRQIVEAIYDDVPDRLAQVVELCAFSHLTYVEAGALIGSPPGTVDTRMRTFWELVILAAPKVNAPQS